MTRYRVVIFVTTLCLAWGAPSGSLFANEQDGPAPAQPSKAPDESGARTSEAALSSKEEVAEIAEVPKFAPPNRPFPDTRVGAATRGPATAEPSGIEALVPEGGGLTLEEQPVLYWYLEKHTSGRVEFGVTETNSLEPMLETTIDGPFHPGVQRIRLADHALSLKPETHYQWFVSLVSPRGQELDGGIIGGGIQRVEASSQLESRLEAAGDSRAAFVLAQAGIWYDAVDALSKRIDASPGVAQLRNQRAALFEQVGLGEVALRERAAAHLEQR